MTSKERFHAIQARIKRVLDELATPKPPTPESPAPLPAEPVPEPPSEPPAKKHFATIAYGRLSDVWCCPEHETKFQRQGLRHGLIPVGNIIDLQNALQIAPPR